jgi:hypothetical protein
MRTTPRDAAQQRLAAMCERALVACARHERGGTRQQLRSAARRFVRRHRHDAGYLTWVLRSAGASSALAVALLGLGAAPAHAKATIFTALTGAASPLDGAEVGLASAPALGDLDGDGDLDLVSGDRFFGFHYFENTGDTTAAAYAERFDANNPLDGIDIGSFSTPALGDLDADGDLDLVAGELGGGFFYLENTGSASSPAFALRIGAGNPLSPFSVGGDSRPALADLDGDGDLDLVAGEPYGGFAYFENTGNAQSPAFEEITDDSPLGGEDVGFYSAPAFGDLDGDGDLELVAGDAYGGLAYFENTGSPLAAKMDPRTGAANPLHGHSTGLDAMPALGDLDGDGDLDLVAGKLTGEFDVFENRSGRLRELTGADDPLDGLGVENLAAPAHGDLDADGDTDLVTGNELGSFEYFENTGSASSPAFTARPGAENPLDGHDVGLISTPRLGDLDGDGDLDLVSGENGGGFFYFENTGSAASPAFVARTGAQNPLDGRDVGIESTFALGDLDADGDLDGVAGELTGAFFYFENTGSAGSPAFALRTGAANPLDGQDVGLASAPALGDVDGDGDLDLVSGEGDTPAAFFYFENTGTVTGPAFVARTGAANPVEQQVGYYTIPALADLDGDGDLDLVAGDGLGAFSYHENTIVKPALSASERMGAADPLHLQGVTFHSRPALGDLDRDGDLDLLASEAIGSVAFFENTGGAIAPAFARRSGAANPLEGEDVGSETTLALADLDADGDLDLVGGSASDGLSLFANTGSAVSPDFVLATGGANPFDGFDVGIHAAPAPADLDGDGDLDLVVGNATGAFLYLENTGSVTSPAFIERTGVASPLFGIDVDPDARPALGDLDRDRDLDLLAGMGNGTFFIFENRGTATSPSLSALLDNPLAGESVGLDSSPTLGDLDGDGDLDLVSGNADGLFRTYYLPEPGHGALLGAGLALLGWLRRQRPRQR